MSRDWPWPWSYTGFDQRCASLRVELAVELKINLRLIESAGADVSPLSAARGGVAMRTLVIDSQRGEVLPARYEIASLAPERNH